MLAGRHDSLSFSSIPGSPPLLNYTSATHVLSSPSGVQLAGTQLSIKLRADLLAASHHLVGVVFGRGILPLELGVEVTCAGSSACLDGTQGGAGNTEHRIAGRRQRSEDALRRRRGAHSTKQSSTFQQPSPRHPSLPQHGRTPVADVDLHPHIVAVVGGGSVGGLSAPLLLLLV